MEKIIIPALDEERMQEVRAGYAKIDKPAANLGKLEDMVVGLAGMMGKAWNLGNALDSTSDGTVGETLWNNKFPVSKEMFDAVKAAGFDTVRHYRLRIYGKSKTGSGRGNFCESFCNR